MARENATVEDESTADRGIPQLNTRRGGAPAAVKIIVVLAVVVAILGAVAFVALQKFQANRQANKRVEETAQVTAQLPKLEQSQIEAEIDNNTPLPEEQEPAATQATVPATASAPSTGANGQHVVPSLSPQEQAELDLRTRRQQAPLMAYGEEDQAEGSQTPAAALGAIPGAASLAAAGMPGWPFPQPAAAAEPPAGLKASLEGTEMQAVAAQVLQDPNMTLTQASVIPCVLNTAINSTVPGMVSCSVSSNVYSTNGRVLLIERGSRIVGEYQNGQLKQGMNRIFVVWTRVETPQGVTIALDSPATDALGRSGIGGKVNRHFWERFGAGLLLSLVDDVVEYAVARQTSNTDDTERVEFSSTSQAGKDAASIAVENSVGIPPTLSVAQGAIVNVFVARDLYFGNVYGLSTALR